MNPLADSIAIIIPAGGTSSRFGSDKLHADLRGKHVLRWTLEAFSMRLNRDVRQIVLATSNQSLLQLVPEASISRSGAGPTRAHTVRSALAVIDPAIEWVAIHDAARPLVSQELISRVFEAAKKHGAAAPAMPVALTIKQAGTSLPSRVERTVPRQSLWAMQTPQIMRRADLIDAFDRCPIPLDQVTDDLQLLELAGKPVTLVPGEERNIKLTTAIDLKIAEIMLDEQQA